MAGACATLWTKIIEQTRSPYRSPEFDYDFELSLMPVRDGIVGVYVLEKDFLEEAFLADPHVETYSYWDNTDRPESIAAKEWSKRKQVWDEALQGSSTPGSRGLSIQIVSGKDLVIRHDLRSIVRDRHIPSAQARVETVSGSVQTTLSMKRICEERGINIEDVDQETWYKFFFRAMDDKDTRTAVQERILQELVRDLTVDDLWVPPPEAAPQQEEPGHPAPSV